MTERAKVDRAEWLQAFGSWMEHPDDAARINAHRLADRSLESGVPLLELVDTVIGTFIANARKTGDAAQVARVLDSAEAFMLECVAPYDQALREATDSRLGLRSRSEQMEEQVRRIAHELHDSSAQLVASAHTELHRVTESAPNELLPRLQRLRALLNQVEIDLRRFAHELRPTILDDLGLVPALHELARNLSHQNGTIVAVEGPADERFPSPVETALYRTVQEALSNGVRHSRPRRVKVKIESDENEIRCSIADDGSGMNSRSSATQRGLGLIGIRERLAALGGTLVSETRSDGRGTQLLASIPLEVSHVSTRFDR